MIAHAAEAAWSSRLWTAAPTRSQLAARGRWARRVCRESLSRSSVNVAVTEAKQPGVTQREDIERAKLRRTILGLNASMDVSRNLNFTAAYATDLQRAKESQRVNLLANFQF